MAAPAKVGMKYAVTHSAGSVEILANDHYVGRAFTAEEDHKAGDIVVHGETYIGVCLYDVETGEVGTMVIHGFINANKLTEEQMAAVAQYASYMPLVQFVIEA